MKQILTYALLVAALASCTNGKNPKGTPIDTDTLPAPEQVATLDPNDKSSDALTISRSASFENFFNAEVNDEGVVYVQFTNLDDEEFPMIFNEENCPTERFAIEASGRVRGISVLIEGSSVDPVLFLLMDDTHAERISLYELSCGEKKTVFRSAQSGVTMFEEYTHPEAEGQMIVGIDADGNRIEFDWKKL